MLLAHLQANGGSVRRDQHGVIRHRAHRGRCAQSRWARRARLELAGRACPAGRRRVLARSAAGGQEPSEDRACHEKLEPHGESALSVPPREAVAREPLAASGVRQPQDVLEVRGRGRGGADGRRVQGASHKGSATTSATPVLTSNATECRSSCGIQSPSRWVAVPSANARRGDPAASPASAWLRASRRSPRGPATPSGPAVLGAIA